MRWVCVIGMVICMFNNKSYAQITQSIDEELTTESDEVNEEIRQKFTSKISFIEFINDNSIYSLFISEEQHQKLLEHIENTGNLKSLLELQSTGFFTYREYVILQQFIEIQDEEITSTKNAIKITSRGNYTSIKTDQHIGGQWGNYQQIKINLQNNYKIGLAREVDIGEDNNILFPDHEALFINKKWRKNEISIGDYQVFHGLGLLIGQGFSASFGNGGISNSIQHRWTPNANQTEINTFRGIFVRKGFKHNTFSLGLSIQNKDLGTPTGLHRTTSEIDKKNKNKEGILIWAYEYNSRSFQNKTLVIYDRIGSNSGISNSIQAYYRNCVFFSEIANFNSKIASSVGMMIMISKDIPISLAYTNFENEYASPWKSYTNQGFSINDGAGININIHLPIYKRIQLDYSYRYNTKTDLDKDYFKSSKYYHAIRFEYFVNKNIQFSNVNIAQYDNDLNANIRSKISIKLNSNERFKQLYQFYLNSNSADISNAIAYHIVYRNKNIQAIYSIALFNIKPSLAIYFQIDNILISKQNVGIYDTGRLQCFGLQYKLNRRFNLGMFIQHSNNTTDLEKSSKLLYTLNFK